MNSSAFDNMGPRIDLGSDDSGSGQTRDSASRGITLGGGAGAGPERRGGGSKFISLLALVAGVLALILAVWTMMNPAEPMLSPFQSPQVVPGATAERTAKLEKDVQDLMLRLVTLEKELRALGHKAGSVAKLSQLSSKVAALQSRLDSLSLEKRVSSLAGGAPAPPPRAAPQAAPKAVERPKPRAVRSVIRPKPKPAKRTYTVRRGDSLFSIAVRYKVTVAQLKRWNKIRNSRSLKAGQKLVIYRGG